MSAVAQKSVAILGLGEAAVGIFDLFAFLDMFTLLPGPSGTTVGTLACP